MDSSKIAIYGAVSDLNFEFANQLDTLFCFDTVCSPMAGTWREWLEAVEAVFSRRLSPSLP